MFHQSIWQDLQDLVLIALRLGYRVFCIVVGCAFVYQAYKAWRSVILGVESNASAPSRNPGGASSRLAEAAWGTLALGIAAIAFAVVFFGGNVVLGFLLSPLSDD
jgi:hypothetical protein